MLVHRISYVSVRHHNTCLTQYHPYLSVELESLIGDNHVGMMEGGVR